MTSLIPPPPLPGDQVASYTLIETLGVGGNATVYRATSKNGDDVAVKILHPGKSTEEDVRRFRREFLSLQSLQHPNIVQVYEAGFHGDYPWISMELVSGMDLNSLIKKWRADKTEAHYTQIESILKGLCRFGLLFAAFNQLNTYLIILVGNLRTLKFSLDLWRVEPKDV